MSARGRLLALLLLCLPLAACFQLGQTRLGEDHLGFSRALSDSDKQQTLLNIVRLRYGDTPTFLDTTQVISGYQLQRNVSGGFEVFPNGPLGTFLSGTGSAQLQQSPTFTFQPVTGEHFAQSFLRPLSLADLLPLVQGGLPIDVLFRLAVQSVGPLQNAMPLTRDANGGSLDFFTVIHALRRLQEAGLLGARIERESRTASDGKTIPGPEHVFLTIASSTDPALGSSMAEISRLLALPPGITDIEMVYGRAPRGRRQVAVLTLPMLGVLAQLAYQVDVPSRDVSSGRTVPSVHQSVNEPRPTVVIQSGLDMPAQAFSAVQYQGTWFWIADNDFDSKVAFTTVNVLLALAKTSSSPNTVITIPAR